MDQQQKLQNNLRRLIASWDKGIAQAKKLLDENVLITSDHVIDVSLLADEASREIFYESLDEEIKDSPAVNYSSLFIHDEGPEPEDEDEISFYFKSS